MKNGLGGVVEVIEFGINSKVSCFYIFKFFFFLLIMVKVWGWKDVDGEWRDWVLSFVLWSYWILIWFWFCCWFDLFEERKEEKVRGWVGW